MDPLSGLIGGGISLLGGIIANESREDQANMANFQNAFQSELSRQFANKQGSISRDFNAWQSQLGRDFVNVESQEARDFTAAQTMQQLLFQERMSSSAYQRAMADMRAGGLNPMLAFSKGGASSPAGGAGSASAPGAPTASSGAVSAPGTPAAAVAQMADVLTPAVSSAMQATRLNEEVKNMIETNKEIQQRVQNLKMEEIRTGAQVSNIAADTKIKDEFWVNAAKEATKADTDKKFYDSQWGKAMRMIGLTGKELNPFGGSGSFVDRWSGTTGR